MFPNTRRKQIFYPCLVTLVIAVISLVVIAPNTVAALNSYGFGLAASPHGNGFPTLNSYGFGITTASPNGYGFLKHHPIPPDTTITSAVDGNGATLQSGGTSSSNSVTFTFTATAGTNPIAGFQCSLDNGAFSSCTSPTIVNNLAAGTHNFQVRAVDTSGTSDLTPASFSWTIVASSPPPSTVIGGTIVPLYTYPTDSSWNTIISVKDAHPNVPIVAIINPNSGPGSSRDINFANGINTLRTHGIIVIGYVYTSYAGRSIANVENDINAYHSWYPNLNGIMFDEMSNVAGHESYYSTVSQYVKSLVGFTYTVGNPGTDTIPSYVGTVDTITIYENSGLPSLSYLDGWHSNYPRSNWAIVPYNVPSLDQSFVTQAKNYVGYIYITSDNLPNPWNTLSAYFSTLISDLD